MSTYYVYGHFIPGEDTPFYIGKGTGRRYKKTDNRNKWWKHIAEKYGYESRILQEGLTDEEACKLEKQLIVQYGRRDLNTGVLVNLTDGGETSQGYKLTDEQKLQRGKNSKRMWAEKSKEERHIIRMTDWQTRSDEQKEVHKENTKKNRKYVPLSEDTKRKIRESLKEKWSALPDEEKELHRQRGKEASLKRWNKS